jgi:hypothetical protein
VNQFKRQREYANNIRVASKGHETFEDIFNTLPSTQDKVATECAGGLVLQPHVLPKTTNKGKWVEFPFDLFNAQNYIQVAKQDGCHSYTECMERDPNAITISMWANTWHGNDAMQLEWSSTGFTPSTANYTISTKNRNEISVSGIHEKDFCWECTIGKGKPSCLARLDFVIKRYKGNVEWPIDELLENLPQCRDATSPSSRYFVNASRLAHDNLSNA